jgi:hypothetical protein
MAASAKYIRGKSIQQTYSLATSYVIHKGDFMVFTDGQVTRASSSVGISDSPLAGIYEGPEISTSDRAATDVIQLRVPIEPFIFEADTSGTVSTATIGNQFGVATSEISSGTGMMVGVANTTFGNFIHIGGTNSSGRNLFMGLMGTVANVT